MLRYLQPKSLYALALSSVDDTIKRSCDTFQKLYGDYDSEMCQEQCRKLQEYLLSSIPVLVADELYENSKFCYQHPYQEVLKEDVRMRLAIYMHPMMRKFSAAHVTSETKQDLSNFWFNNLPKLTMLVFLNLDHVATDEIIEVVSKNCLLLEGINIVSRVGRTPHSDYNAMRLKFYVSDKGLGHLINCKNLRTVITNRVLTSNCGITHGGLRTLLKKLKKLETLCYGDVGSIIASEMEDVKELPLVVLRTARPDSNTIKSISKLCPRLTHLCLCLKYIIWHSSAREDKIDEISLALVESDIKVSILHLQNWYFNSATENILAVKGVYLTSLFVSSSSDVSSIEIVIIGKHCPNLENVRISYLGPELYDENTPETGIRFPLMFRNLRWLWLDGTEWDIWKVLSIFISNASKLTSLNIWNKYCKDSSIILTTLITNFPLFELEHAVVGFDFKLSIDAIKKFLDTFKKLKFLAIFPDDELQDDEFKKFCEGLERLITIEFLTGTTIPSAMNGLKDTSFCY